MRYFCLLASIFILSACTRGAVLLSPANQPALPPTPTVVIVSIDSAPTADGAELAGPQVDPVEADQAVIATVNNIPIPRAVYRKQLTSLEQTLTGQGIDLHSEAGQKIFTAAAEEALNSLINQQLIEQYAISLGLAISEEELTAKAQEIEAQIADQTQLERWLANNQISYQDYLIDLRAQFTASRVYEHVTQQAAATAPHIRLQYLRAPDRATAETLHQKLKEGAKFTDLVQQQTGQPAGVSGDFLDWFPRQANLIPTPVEAVAFALTPGEISGPVEADDGFYLIKLEGKETTRPLSQEMQSVLKKQIFIAWLEEQRALATVEIFAAVH